VAELLLLCEAAGLDLTRFVPALRAAPGPRGQGPLEAWAPLPGRALVAVRVDGASQGQLQLAFQTALGDEEAPGRFAGKLRGAPTIWTGAGAEEGWTDLASVARSSDVPPAVLEALAAGKTTGEVLTLALEPPPDAAALEAATRKLEGWLGPSPAACVLRDAADDEGPLPEEEEAPAEQAERPPTPADDAARAAAAASSALLLKLFGLFMAVFLVLVVVFAAMAKQKQDAEAAQRREWEKAGTDLPYETWKLQRR
jgi:hypothetical protein